MAMGYVARDPQSQPVPLLLPGQTEVRLEHLLHLLLRHPRPPVIHLQHEPSAVSMMRSRARSPYLMALSIRLPMQRRNASGLPGYGASARPSSVMRPSPVRLGQISSTWLRSTGSMFSWMSVSFTHCNAPLTSSSSSSSPAELGLQTLVLQQLDAQAQAGDRCAQVVGDGTEQLAALGQVAADALAHAVERAPHLDHFTATAFGHWRHISAQRHLPRSPRQALERPALPVHQQADEQQQQRRGQHDEAYLLARQALGFRAGVGLGQQRGDVQPLALARRICVTSTGGLSGSVVSE